MNISIMIIIIIIIIIIIVILSFFDSFHRPIICDSELDSDIQRDELKYSEREFGVRSAMITGTWQMLTLCADKPDLAQHSKLSVMLLSVVELEG